MSKGKGKESKMKTIEVYKERNGKYEFAGTKNIEKAGKVEFWDGSRKCERTAYVAEDGSKWVKVCGQFHVLSDNSFVVDGIFAE